jgi:hypothetical protein
MGDDYTEVSEKGWFQRIGESIAGVAVGAVLFLAAFPVLFMNEGCAVRREQALTEGAGAVVTVKTDAVDAANEGKLVHFSGKADTTETLKDPVFGVSAKAIRLERLVEMFQWVEHKKEEKKKELGGKEKTITTYSYTKEWKDKAVDTASFNSKFAAEEAKKLGLASLVNPPMKHTGEQWTAKVVTVGAFTLPENLVKSINKSEPLAVKDEDLKNLPGAAKTDAKADPAKTPDGTKPADAKPMGMPTPPTMGMPTPPTMGVPAPTPTPAGKDQPRVENGQFYIGKNPADPAVGDMRISFKVVNPTEVTVVGEQTGSTLRAYQTKAGGTIEELRLGSMSSAELFQKLQDENTMFTWIVRVVGFIAMAIGIYLVFAPIQTFADVVPLIGDLIGAGLFLFAMLSALCLSLITIAVGWIFYRPVLGITLLVVAVGLIVLLRVMGGKKAKTV